LDTPSYERARARLLAHLSPIINCD